MNLIEQLGGYEKAKSMCDHINGPLGLITDGYSHYTKAMVVDALLEFFQDAAACMVVADDQHHEQPRDQRAAACPDQQIACIQFFHYLAPAWTDRTTVPM